MMDNSKEEKRSEDAVEARRLKQRGGRFGRAFLHFCARYLGRWSLYVVAFPIVFYFVLVERQTRKLLKRYWRRVRPGKFFLTYWIYIYRQYFEFGISMMDRFLTKPSDIILHGSEEVLKTIRGDLGAVFLASHFGGYGQFHHFPEFKERMINIMMYQPEEDRSLVRQGSGSGVRYIDPSRPLESLFIGKQVLENGELLFIMGDRVTIRKRNTETFRIHGMDMVFPVGPWRLAEAGGAVLYSIFIIRKKKQYHVYLSPSVDFSDTRGELMDRGRLREAMGVYSGMLENMIEKYPFQWFNFGVEMLSDR